MSRFANTIAAVTGAYVAASFAVQLLNWRSRKGWRWTSRSCVHDSLNTLSLIPYQAYPLPPLPDAIAQKSTRIPLKRRPNISLRVVYIAHRLGPNVPLVVFLHGMGAGVHSWIEQIEVG